MIDDLENIAGPTRITVGPAPIAMPESFPMSIPGFSPTSQADMLYQQAAQGQLEDLQRQSGSVSQQLATINQSIASTPMTPETDWREGLAYGLATALPMLIGGVSDGSRGLSLGGAASAAVAPNAMQMYENERARKARALRLNLQQQIAQKQLLQKQQLDIASDQRKVSADLLEDQARLADKREGRAFQEEMLDRRAAASDARLAATLGAQAQRDELAFERKSVGNYRNRMSTISENHANIKGSIDAVRAAMKAGDSAALDSASKSLRSAGLAFLRNPGAALGEGEIEINDFAPIPLSQAASRPGDYLKQQFYGGFEKKLQDLESTVSRVFERANRQAASDYQVAPTIVSPYQDSSTRNADPSMDAFMDKLNSIGR